MYYTAHEVSLKTFIKNVQSRKIGKPDTSKNFGSGQAKVHNQGNQNIVRPPMSDGELALISKYISMELFANLPTYTWVLCVGDL